jgi:hypothetical protein
MKAGVTPMVSSAWWKSNKGMTVKGAVLEGALKVYESARLNFTNKASANSAEAFQLYMEAKKALSVDVSKAVDATISSCNKLLHKDDIAGLEKYHSTAIPKEKGTLDKLFKDFEGRYQRIVDDMKGEMEAYVSALDPIAKLSAKTVLECEALESDADRALADATTAKAAADASEAMQRAVKAGAAAAKAEAALNDAVKRKPTKFGFDRSKLIQEDRTGLTKIVDQKSKLESQIENNVCRVAKIAAQVRNTMAQARKVVEGAAKKEDVLAAAFDRLVNRAFSLAQLSDQPAREMKAAISNLDGDISAYKSAKTPNEKQLHMGRATENVRLAHVHANSLQQHLNKSQKEIGGLLDSMPRAVVNPENPVFTKMFKELERATESFGNDEATLEKELGKLKQMEAEVKKMN